MGSDAFLKDLFRFPLVEALFGRRSRRFGLGMEVPSGPFKYKSTESPLAIDELERAILLLCGAGISGWSTGLEHTSVAKGEGGCNYALRTVGRTIASGAGALTAELIVSDDSGTIITKFRNRKTDGWGKFDLASDRERILKIAQESSIKLFNHRVDLPNELPHVPSHNQWSVGKPGTTLFLPVVDMTTYMLNLIAIYLGMGYIPYDFANDRPCGNLEPYIKSGLLNVNRRFPLIELEQHVLASCAIEAAQVCHNLVLTLQAMGLGGWMFTGMNSYSLLGGFSHEGVEGLGFRFQRDKRWPSPNPVGLDRHFEAMCPPYHKDMRSAVEQFVKMKFGDGGVYDPSTAGPYRENDRVKSAIERYSPEFVDMLSEVASYVFEAYGKFPGTVPSIYSRPCVQAQHIDLAYYDKFFGPDSYLQTHREHMRKWHGSSPK